MSAHFVANDGFGGLIAIRVLKAPEED